MSTCAEADRDESTGAEGGFGDELELNPFDGLPFSSRYYTLLEERRALPVWGARGHFHEALAAHQLVVVSGSTQTGRSRQVPQWCAEFCLWAEFRHGGAVSTQTSGQQAVDLALRVADDMDVNIGHEVGYSIPLQSCCSSDTALRFCTDEQLLKEMLSDPFLEHYGVVVVDQAQERTASTDVLLGLLSSVLLQRPELRVVVLTASTLTERLLTHYGSRRLIRLDSSCHAEVIHSSSSKDYFSSALRLVLEIHRAEDGGDVIIFFASEEEVHTARRILRCERSRMGDQLEPVVLSQNQVGPLTLPAEQSAKSRRVFLSSQQGEDVWWIHPVRIVIDSGVQTKMVYNPRVRASSEVLKPVSRCEAEARARLCAPTGKCFRLYPEERLSRPESSPQILDSNITPTVLFLKRMEIAGLGPCRFMDRPDPEGLMQALEELDYLAALDNDGNLSEIGIVMSEIPVDPQMAKALLASCEFDCVSEMLTIAAMLSAPSCFLKPPAGATLEATWCRRKFQHPEGDHFTLINIYNAFKTSQTDPFLNTQTWCTDHFLDPSALNMADAVRSDLSETLKRVELPVSEAAFGTETNTDGIKRALLAGFFMQIARDVDGSGNYFMLAHKHMAQVDPLSGFGAQSHKLGLPEWLVFSEYSLSDNCMKTVSRISPQVFIETAPLYFFYNLPPSESKDILQDMLEPTRTTSCTNQQAAAISCDVSRVTAVTHTDRCVLQ